MRRKRDHGVKVTTRLTAEAAEIAKAAETNRVWKDFWHVELCQLARKLRGMKHCLLQVD
jgi:hypothetical protein